MCPGAALLDKKDVSILKGRTATLPAGELAVLAGPRGSVCDQSFPQMSGDSQDKIATLLRASRPVLAPITGESLNDSDIE